MTKFFLEKDDVIIEDGQNKMVVDSIFALFDENGLVSGHYSWIEVDYLDVVESFNNGNKVLDLDGDFPGLWQR